MNYLFYDYETSGTCEKFDQVFQFAAIKTDENFEQVGKPFDFFCKLRPDILPSPHAIKTNKIDITELNSRGVNEFEFAHKVSEVLIGDGNQCVVGFNSKEFDNNFSRFLFYRNFLDPYSWSWAKGNNCLDILDILRLGYSFERLGDICLTNEDGLVSLRLEDLAKSNDLVHADSHNALSDVSATIQLAKLIKARCPRLFAYAEGLKTINGVQKVLHDGEMFFHSSGVNGYDRKLLSVHFPICEHPFNHKSMIGWNLDCDPTTLLAYSSNEIRNQMYAKKEARTLKVGFREFKLNKSPMIVRYLESEDERVHNLEVCKENLEKVKGCLGDLEMLVKQIFNSAVAELDPDADLYAGDYFGEVGRDKKYFDAVKTGPMDVEESAFTSIRLRRLLRRLKARNFFKEICDIEQSTYVTHCSEKFSCVDEGKWRTRTLFDKEYREAMSETTLSDGQKGKLLALRTYADTIH